MAVDLMDVKATPVAKLFCAAKGDKEMFAQFQADLSKPGRVKFPIWYRAPEISGCVYWALVETSRDNAVFLAKQSLYNMLASMFGNDKIAPYVPADINSGNWDCTSSQFGVTAYQAAIQSGLGNIERVALDGVLFAYLLTNSPLIQTLGTNTFAQGVASAGWQDPGGTKQAVVPVPLTDMGSQFVPAPVPASCTTIGPGTGITPGTPGNGLPGVTPVGYEEPPKKPSYLVPALVVGGVVLATGAMIYFGSKARRAPARAGAESYDEESGMLGSEGCGCGGS